jgi:hypothetical protein
MILDPPGTPSGKTTRCCRNTIDEATIRFSNGPQTFLRLRHWNFKDVPGEQADTIAKHLMRANSMVVYRAGRQQLIQMSYVWDRQYDPSV